MNDENFIFFKGGKYPKFQSEGFAAQFAIPVALNVLGGNGVDVGCNRKSWAYPYASFLVDPQIDPQFNAMNFPGDEYDYIFSSHLLEHLNDWVNVLSYWRSKIKTGGKVFLYLPNANDQIYWRPWHNRKHVNYFTPEIIKQYFEDQPQLWNDVYVSGTDANSSFIAYANKS
ncbi:MAG: methyltransferase domain-containing protein [Candidatus Babeliales bacterium]|nr:methyltransferase domain-containing protein [Candidatus Babeliales bacterium]